MSDKRELLMGQLRPFLALNLYCGSDIDMEAASDLAFQVSDIDRKYRRDFCRTHYLIGNKVRSFLESLERLRIQFSHSTQTREKTAIGAIRGPISWGKTLQARMAAGNLAIPLFVTNPRSPTFDTPANHLLGFMLRSLDALLKEVEVPPAPQFADTGSLGAYLGWATHEVKTTLATHQMKSLGGSIPSVVDDRLLERARGSRDDFYVDLVALYEHWARMRLDEDCPVIDSDIVESLLTYSETERLLELAVLFKTIDIFGKRLVQSSASQSWQPLMPQSSYVAKWSLSDGDLTVGLYKTPSFVEDTVYGRLRSQLGMQKSQAIPDISVAWHPKDSSPGWVHFIEVKDTNPLESDYFAKSLYKVIGYSKDFETYFAPSDLVPGVMMVIWDGLSASATEGKIWVTQFASSTSTLEKLADRIMAHLGLP